METNNNSGKDLEDKKWNGENVEKQGKVNEGFSGENLPENYNPSQLKKETETDDEGNKTHVDRARFTDLADESEPPESDKSTDSTDIENRESLQNRDRNYDVSPNRYPPSHPDNHTNRGNIEMDRD